MNQKSRAALKVTSTIATLFLLVLQQAYAQTPSSVIRVGLPNQDTLPVGTEITIIAANSLNSTNAKVGQAVLFRVFRDVTLDQIVVIPAGSAASGTVVRVRRAGAFGRAGSITVSCDELTLPDGSSVPLKIQGQTAVEGRSTAGSSTAAGVILGLTVGGVVADESNFQQNFGSNSNDSSGPAAEGVLAGLGTGLLVAALFQGGNATIQSGQLFSAALQKNIPLPATGSQ